MVFRSLELRIVVFFVILLAAVQVTAFFLVSAANQEIAKREIANQLEIGERVFKRLIEQNGRQLSQAATVLAADFGFREAIATRDMGTIVSVLGNHGARVNASVVMLVGLDNNLLADTLRSDQTGKPFAFPDLIAAAQERRQASAVVLIDGQPFQLVVVPVLAPLPIAWVAMGFAINDRLAQDMRALTTLHVSFLVGQANNRWALSASTLPVEEKERLPPRLTDAFRDTAATTSVSLRDREYETRALVLQRQGESRIVVALQQSLETALQPFNQLSRTLIALALASILVSIAGSIVLGRNLTRPISRLTASTRRMRDGDYTQAVEVSQQDEIGELASSFNHMREAISTREEKILRLAYQDTLTSLPNRALFNDRLELAIKAAERSKSPVTILVMDLDRFKYVNDALGHPVGDMVLTEVGARLQALLRHSDTVARLGGDEFALILPNADTAAAETVALSIHRALELPIMLKGQPLDVGSSIGIASYPEHGLDPSVLMRHADIAMYVAKRGNRGYAVYSKAFYQPNDNLLRLLGDLRHAVERDELVLHFQPKIEMQSGTTTHVEALIRWIHPERGFIPPSEFIPFAEHTGFIRTITLKVIQKAVQQCRLWQDKGLTMVISFNISSRDLINPELPNLVENELAKSGLDPHCIAIEVTESGFMEDPAQALEILNRLNKLGVSLSIDDYGTGYSSLSYIKKLPVQELKIDQSFVKNMVTDKDDATIVKSTIDLGHNMGLKVVAEGVEDVESWNLLKQLGCDYAQGYFMSKPLPAQQFEVWLASAKY